jgi:hypothetical protein
VSLKDFRTKKRFFLHLFKDKRLGGCCFRLSCIKKVVGKSSKDKSRGIDIVDMSIIIFA